jgi:hypothetical protein
MDYFGSRPLAWQSFGVWPAQVTPTATLEIRLDGQVVKAGDVRNLQVGVYFLLYTATRRDQQISKATSIAGVWGLTSRFRSHMSRLPAYEPASGRAAKRQ